MISNINVLFTLREMRQYLKIISVALQFELICSINYKNIFLNLSINIKSIADISKIQMQRMLHFT